MRKKRNEETTNQEYQQRIESHYEIDESGCYLWTAAKNNIGFGFFRYKGKMVTAHRAVMDLEGHDIENKTVYHTCDNYNCVNPEHLRVGSMLDKSKVMTDKGRSGRAYTDPTLFKTCKHCGFVCNAAVIGKLHNKRCKYKP